MKNWMALAFGLGLMNVAFGADKDCNVDHVKTSVNPQRDTEGIRSDEDVTYVLHCPDEFKIRTTKPMSIELLLRARDSGKKIRVNYDETERNNGGVFTSYGITY
jgi:hypothetical protein